MADDRLMSANRYEKINCLGSVYHGKLYRARDTLNNEIVAIKKLKLTTHNDVNGLNILIVREIKLLRRIEHENVTTVRDIFGDTNTVQIVMDFMETDLKEQLSYHQFSPAQIKNMTLQLLRGLEYLHKLGIMHRNLEPSNLLLNNVGRLKINDFGLARVMESPGHKYTNLVVPIWYRAPELLFGARSYGTEIDIWSVGCIIGELFICSTVFPGTSELDQLSKICDVLGVPTEENWTGVTKLPNYILLNVEPTSNLDTVFPVATNDTLELITSCFKYDPKERCTATSALEMEYFKSAPFPCHDSQLARVYLP